MLPTITDNIESRLTIEDVLSYYKAKPSAQQLDAPRITRHFCPFRRCQGDKRPHFVIEHEKRVDVYGKKITDGQHINKDAVVKVHWRCDHSHVDGYGVLSLIAAIQGYNSDLSQLTRNQWVDTITIGASIAGLPTTELDKEAVNGWLKVYAPQTRWAIRIADDFSADAYRALSIDGMEGVSAKHINKVMHEQFGLWQVERYTMAGCYPNGDHSSADLFKSYERRAHSLFPMFVFAYDWESGAVLTENPEKREDKWVGRIVLPAFVRQRGEDFDWRNDMWVVFNSDDPKGDMREWNMRVSILGDADAMEVVAKMNAGEVADRIGEEVERTYTETDDVVDERTGKTKQEAVEKPIEPQNIRLNKCVLCRKPLDGVSVYLWLNYPRFRFAKDDGNSSYYAKKFWHVAWLKGDDYVLNPWENMMLKRIASDTFELFGNDRSEISMANANAMRYDYLRLCMLPTSMSEMDAVDSGCGLRHTPHTPQDFFRYYRPTMDERVRNNMLVGSDVGVKALMLQKELNGSSSLKPFTRVEKSRKKVGEKNYTYEINMAATWQMMANKGYCRSIPAGSRSTIGQCYRIDGHFVYELDAASVMADMRKSLEDFAKDKADGNVDDAEMMMNAMLKCKDLQYDRNITKLPLMAMPKSESYGPDIDYFFFRNGALEITPSHITFRKYEDLDFLIYRSQIMPFDYNAPFFGSQSPISIRINPEYQKRKDAYEAARREGVLSREELYDMNQRLKDFATVGQWDINIKPTSEDIDERIIVPGIVRNDKDHNQWLRWWPFLRLIRCWANEDFQKEEDGQFTDGDRQALTARMANLMFTIGRCIYRYHDNIQYMPFFLENTVDREGKAQGGSGKSMLVQQFLGFARNILQVNAKNMGRTEDFANFFSGFVPHFHDVIHIEDFPKMAIDPFFNYATGRFEYRVKYADVQHMDHSESPMVVFTSNFVVQSTDESALGRIQFGGMSHYFSREVETYNKEGRSMDTIDPDFCYKPQDCTPEQRGQVIYTLAKCVQFCMNATALKVKVAVPGNDLLERLSRTELGDTFYDWFTEFLERPYIYNAPISINEIFNEYRKYYDPSKARFDSVSRTKFYEGMQKYCSKPAHGVVFMGIKNMLSPSEVTRSRKKSTDGTEKSYIRKGSSWFTRTFVDGDGKVHHARVLSKNAGDNSVTGGAVWFSRRGEEMPSPKEFLQMLDDYCNQPDPAPILDADGNPITEEQYSQWTMLNTEEEAEAIRKAGGMRRIVQTTNVPTAPISDGGIFPQAPNEALPNEPYPF